jgi:alpha-1,2-mannosyltransferase
VADSDPIRRPDRGREAGESTGRADVVARGSGAVGRALLASTIVIGLAAVWFAVRAHHYHDLRVYQGALRSWVHGGDLYSYVLPEERRFGFTYPPFSAILMLPLVAIPLPVAEIGSVLATVAAIVIAMYALVGPIATRFAQPRGQVVASAVLLALGLDAVRQTLAAGQIDMYVFLLVALDLMVLPLATGGASRWAGVGIGLATAIKLMPAVFLAYLLVAGRYRQAVVAVSTFLAAGLVAIVVAPHESWIYWTRVLWRFDRVGSPAQTSNQSVRGMLARLGLNGSVTVWWLISVGLLTAIWWVRVLRATRLGDSLGGFALTGAYVCLLAPITWVHHLVFLLPALVRLTVWAGESGWRSRRLVAVGFCYAVLASQVEELRLDLDSRMLVLFVDSAYVWVTLAFLLLLPLRPDAAARRLGDRVSAVSGERRN